MTIKFKTALLILAASLLGACTKVPPVFAVNGVSVENHGAIARIREGSMLLRGVDSKEFDFSKLPNPFADFVYGIEPGTRMLWGKNIQGGHPLVPDKLRCYVLEANLVAGVIYRLEEDKEKIQAVLKREDTGAQVATGRLVDQHDAYSEGCNWNKR